MSPDEMSFLQKLKWRCIWSWSGVRDTWVTEASFRSWVWANLVSAALAIWLLHGAELALILALGVLILAMELINTAIEHAIDLHSLERSDLARKAKDAGSASVAVAAIAAGIAWVVVLAT